MPGVAERQLGPCDGTLPGRTPYRTLGLTQGQPWLQTKTLDTPGGSSVGATLRATRKRKSLSIEEVAQTTRIATHVLRELERDEFDSLANDVFIRGFLRAYSRSLGLKEAAIIDAYEHQRPSKPSNSTPLAAVIPPERGHRFGLAIAIMVLLILFTLALSIVMRPRTQHGPVELARLEPTGPTPDPCRPYLTEAIMGPQTGQRDTGDSTRALVIRSTAYRDADRIVTLLTENAGRISVLGRKARQSYRRFGGALEPFALIRVRVAPARGDLYYAREAQIVSVYRGVLASWSKMAAAASSLRWLARCAPENHADPDVFETTVAMLEDPQHQPIDACREPDHRPSDSDIGSVGIAPTSGYMRMLRPKGT